MNPLALPVPLVTGTEVTFWIVAPLMVLGALGLVFFRKAVYGALSMAFVMVLLAVLYAAMDAPFLFAVQIIVYTGAIMMLFLFVLMLVGIDTPDSTVETLPGQRVLGFLAVTGMAALLLYAIAGSITGRPKTSKEIAVLTGLPGKAMTGTPCHRAQPCGLPGCMRT